MNKRYLLVIAVLISLSIHAQVTSDYAVQLNVTTQVSPPVIRLHWKKLTGISGYTIFRKAKDDISWTTIGTATTTDSVYNDQAVIVDSSYEYLVLANGGANGTGYIYAGIKSPAIHNHGTMILLVDSLFIDSCKGQIAQLMSDLRADGWALIRHDIARTAPVPSVKSLIQSDYSSHPGTNGLLLLGHIPVPYSGDLNPDGHPDHLGAWPADAYYADMNGLWTDNSLLDTAASRTQNRNKPGDGKFDQTILPSDLELQTGRIDFANMPAISRTEVRMMQNYLYKDHVYKMDSLAVIRKGVIDDNFGAFNGEAFAANAWRMFPTVVGPANILSADFETILKDSAYQWAYGCGGGSYTTASGIGATADFNTGAVKGIFTMMFGSYFGDWDAQNNFLRAPLCAAEPALTSCWAGRPNWFFHHMSLGETIGYSTRLSQNNSIALYSPTNYGAYWVHAALMGDPSLRNDYIKPSSNFTITSLPNQGATLSWNASPDPLVIGYYVYRCDSAWGSYTRLSSMLTTTSYADTKGSNGKKFYLVRPVKLQQGFSGGYYNLGLGILDSANVTYPLGIQTYNGQDRISVFPNPASNNLQLLLEANATEQANLRIINMTGSLMAESMKSIHPGTNSFTWNISTWPEGVYTLLIETRDGIQVRKCLKLAQ